MKNIRSLLVAMFLCQVIFTPHSFASSVINFVSIEKPHVTFAVPEDWVEQNIEWMEPTAQNSYSQIADFSEPDESKPRDIRARVHIALQLIKSNPEDTLTLMKEGVTANLKLMKKDAVHLDESPRIIEFKGYKALVWKWTLTQQSNDTGTKFSAPTKMIYIAGKKYIYKLNFTGDENLWGETLSKVIQSIQIDIGTP